MLPPRCCVINDLKPDTIPDSLHHRQLLPRQVAPPTRQRTANPHPARRPRQPHTDRREHTPRRRRRPLLSGTPTHNRLIHPQPTRNIPTHTHSGEPTARHRTHTRTVITPTPTHHLAARLQSTPHPRPQFHRHEPVIRPGLAAAGRRDLHALRAVSPPGGAGTTGSRGGVSVVLVETSGGPTGASEPTVTSPRRGSGTAASSPAGAHAVASSHTTNATTPAPRPRRRSVAPHRTKRRAAAGVRVRPAISAGAG